MAYLASTDRRQAWHKNRFLVFQRDNFTCIYCGRNVNEDKIKLVIDHLMPKALGGSDSLSNYVTSCVECNSGKADFCLEQSQLLKLTRSIEAK